MPDAAGRPRIPPWFFAVLCALTLVFLAAGLRRSNAGTLRGDEIVSHFSNTRKQSLGDFIVHGARPQVSPAPLLYIIDKGMNAARRPLGYLGLTPPGYIRLPSLLLSAVLGAAAAVLVALKLRNQEGPASAVPYLLLLCGLAVYWFHPKGFPFACTERPYALWNGLWLFFLAWMLTRTSSPLVPSITLSLMAATAVAACFQVLAVGVALLVVRRLEARSARDILREGALMLGPAALVGVYYAAQTQHLDFEERDYGEASTGFVRFWLLTQFPAWIAVGAACALALRRPALRSSAVPPLALAALLLLMPLMFTLAHSRGYTSPSRQYIWSTTAVPLALFLGAVAWPEFRSRRAAAPLALLAGLGLAGGFTIATMFRAPARNDSRVLACLDAGSPLKVLLRSERPRWLACPASTPAIEVQNLELLAEWIAIRYAALPAVDKLVNIRDENGSLVADPVDGPPERGPEWILLSIKP